MLHYLGQPMVDGTVFGAGSNADLTRERFRQLATARLAEQGQRVLTEATLLYQREAAAMQQKVNATVASRPLYSIGAPQRRIRMPKQPTRLPEQLRRRPLYDGPLTLAGRPVLTATPGGRAYAAGPKAPEAPLDLSKPLDLSMKAGQDPRLLMTKAGEVLQACPPAHELGAGAPAASSVPTMYRPAPMISYGKNSRHPALQHTQQQASLLTKEGPVSVSQLHPLAPVALGPLTQSARAASLKRPAPVAVCAASGIPLKRPALADSTLTLYSAKDQLRAVPTSAAALQGYREAGRAAFLAYKRGREQADAALVKQQGQELPLKITDVRSIAGKQAPAAGNGSSAGAPGSSGKPTAGQSRPRSSGGSAPVFHHIHHHHHHHHVPPTDKELLHGASNGSAGLPHRAGVAAPAAVLQRTDPATPSNGLQAHEVPIHRLVHGRGTHGRDAPIHGVVAPAVPARDGSGAGVLIRHAAAPASSVAGTSPHLRRAHYHTRRRYRSISPPVLREDNPRAPSGEQRPHRHQHHLISRAASPLKLVASSIAAGAKMNELLKPLDGPTEHPSAAARAHKVGISNNDNNSSSSSSTKVLVAGKLARPLRVDIPDDRAFVGHLGAVLSSQSNPVPLVRQVSTAVVKCLPPDAIPAASGSSSPKKTGASSTTTGNESPTMPVLTPQSVYSPCFPTDTAAGLSRGTSSSSTTTAVDSSPAVTSSPFFYNALTLPLHPRKPDSQQDSLEAGRFPPRAAGKDESPPRLLEPRQLPTRRDLDAAAAAERIRVKGALQRQIDGAFLDAAAAFDKKQREQRLLRDAYQRDAYQREAYQREAYQQYMQLYRADAAEIPADKPRKKHGHTYGLKASMDRLKAQQSRKPREGRRTSDSEDRNIFAHLMLQRKRYQAVGAVDTGPPTSASVTSEPMDVIDLTRSPSSSPLPDSVSAEAASGPERAPSGKSTRLAPDLHHLLRERQTVSVSEAIDAVFAAHLPAAPSPVPRSDLSEPRASADTSARRASPEAGQPPDLVLSSSATPSSSVGDTSAASPLRPTRYESETARSSLDLPRSSSAPFTGAPTTVTPGYLTVLDGPNLPAHLRYSPTERTPSHDPRKKLLAAMGVHPPVCGAVSPASVSASLCSTLSPSSGRSTPSKGSARKRSLEISRLENTSSFVAEIRKRKQAVDLLTDTALLDREERALQRAMKRFNEMEKREKVGPSEVTTESPSPARRHLRPLLGNHSPLQRGGRGRGRRFITSRKLNQTDGGPGASGAGRGRRGVAREMLRASSYAGRNTFRDFVPLVLEERTRHSLATRSSARQRKVYHKNARYEMEIEKEQQKFLERKQRLRRSVGGSTSGEDEPASVLTPTTPGRGFKTAPGTVASWPGRRRRAAEDFNADASPDPTPLIKQEPLTPPSPADADGLPAPTIAPLHGDPYPERPAAEDGDSSADSDLRVVMDADNLTKIKLMTPTAYQLLNRAKEPGRGRAKPGGKRKFKTKHLGPVTADIPDEDVTDESALSIKMEVTDEQEASRLPSPEPEPVKMVRPSPPAEMRRLMVNKKLGETYLHRAARLAYDDVAIYCIDYGVVDLNAKDNAGYTPLHECCVHGRLRVALYLLQHGADVNASASDGTRPIHDAVDNNWLALVRLLLMYGADPLIATYSGRTTIRLARTSAMKTFIIGYLNDINGDWELDDDDPYQNNLDLSWHLAGTHSFDSNGLPVSDIFQDIPEENGDHAGEEFLVEISDTPHLTSYNIRLPKERRACNWLLLSDVTRQLATTRAEFLAQAQYRSLRLATLTHDEFAQATRDSQLNSAPSDQSPPDEAVELLELTSDLRAVLGIEEEYV